MDTREEREKYYTNIGLKDVRTKFSTPFFWISVTILVFYTTPHDIILSRSWC